MTAARPVTDADKERVKELHAQGMSRNDIARQLGRSGRTISRIAVELGLTFERAGATAAATAAKVADGQARRAQLQLDALEGAQKLYAQMFAPCKAFNFGGKENTYNDTQLNEPTFVDKRNIAVAMQALANTALRLAEYDKGNDLGDAKSMLGTLAAGLGLAYQQLQAGESEAPDGDQP